MKICLKSLFVVGLLWLALPRLAVAKTGGDGWTTVSTPVRPHSGEPVHITVEGPADGPSSQPAIEYQIVEPGRYNSKLDPEFSKNWVSIPLARSGNNPHWEAVIPGEIQKNRRLVRYRITSGTAGYRLAPDVDDTVPNFAYFVYDGIPGWKGAINPNGDGDERRVTEIPAAMMQRVQAYHLISRRTSVEDATWKQPASFGDREGRKEYRWYGTLVGDDGTVYDHIRFRARGGSWRHAMGKNMWKIDFNHAHKFQARDDYGKPYLAKWSKLNLGACIQQGDYGMRGEQGLFESVGFRLFNAAGVAAPFTHWIQLRVVDGVDESPSDQFRGDFWGLYLVTENLDGNFLKDHDLPNQSVFKMVSFQADVAFQGDDGLNEGDAVQLESQVRQGNQTEAWWRSNVDMPGYYSYRSILECIHHYDLDAGKNYDYRRSPSKGVWTVVPWDIDLTWGDRMFGSGNEPFYAGGALRYPATRREYQNRLRELMDLLYNEEQTGRLIEHCAAILAEPGSKLSIAEADRRHWDWNPVMVSQWAMAFKAGNGLFYNAVSTRDFWGMTGLMKDYVAHRRNSLEARILARQAVPETPRVTLKSGKNPEAKEITLAVESSVTAGAHYQWRLAETTLGSPVKGRPSAAPLLEINAVWAVDGDTTCTVPPGLLKPQHTYRARARAIDGQGNAGHWSEPVPVSLP